MPRPWRADDWLSADIPAPVRADALMLSGSFKVGDAIILKGLATGDVKYTVVSDDLSSDGKGSTQKASDRQALINIAAKLRQAINTAAGRLAQASGNGAGDFAGGDLDDPASGWLSLSASTTGQGKTPSQGRITGTRGASPGAPELDTLLLGGRYAQGDVITLTGIAPKAIAYTVTAADLTRNGDGSGGTATDLEIQTNVAKRIAGIVQAVEQAQKNLASMTSQLNAAVADYQLWGAFDFTGSKKQKIVDLTAKVSALNAAIPQMQGYGATVSLSADANVLVIEGRMANVAFDLKAAVAGKGTLQLVRAARPGQPARHAQALHRCRCDLREVAINGVPSADWKVLSVFAQGTGVLAISNDAAYVGTLVGSTLSFSAQTSGLPAGATGWIASAASETLPAGAGQAQAGSLLLIARANDRLYLADTRDGSVGWKAVASPRAWTAVAVSSDGRTLAGAANGAEGGLWVSSDAGANWRLVDGTEERLGPRSRSMRTARC
jgi:hypothetical protein